ncbi:methionine--tRNA ligase, putative [Plasmodium vivax]|uniref:methionine--tRNA ligase n=6 Tax=Plasmodium vivax TaxID=5855 RepID=A5KDV1_PLAVS|nr:methionine- tRNA ligase, putative [Plasmodium vivax]KMZ81628.1 methionine- tRNA ligase [Plasmodium vivax India VII]KMZ87845.1 methionine- tRNA ligase [Plasmodium vivax Brazil I]KMZ94104.1 methionine- tRNA ligase [Plasmodium vivax Mauritania I]KNA00654.1 methionine- tRNA ligase [Plasmodium vivax North Korean]EDL42397.1 methionine- tRNA ligase, putative [Plasmodium vivax]|eukprot:XP_001608421.1 methionine- tRNA ligase [Plasmodium vivax Sal-1]
MILYPHKYFPNTVKCMLAAHIYSFQVELCDDFFYTRSFDIEKSLVVNKKPLLVYEDNYVSSTKAICFLFHRLRNVESKKCVDEKLRLYMSWVEWSDLLEKHIEVLNKKKIIDSLDELESYLKENPNKNFICSLGEATQGDSNDKLTLADIFVYTSLTHCNIEVCRESWAHISNYIEKINQLEDVQKILKDVDRIYKYKNIYNLFISKIHEKNINTYLKEEKFYITTAINYVNGDPHIGHAYEIVLADAIARYHKNIGRKVFFTTGADEHGLKIANQAARNNLTPQELCDRNVLKFKELNKLLHVDEDYYVRTTCEQHKKIAQEIWTKCEENKDIYLGEYEGWYNVREETYVPENEAKLMNYRDPLNNIKLEKMKEPSYFFNMSKYQQRLIDYIMENPHFIQPEQKRNEILQRLKEPLADLSCSRTKFSWGIPVPSDHKHVMYVWMDALINYYSNCFIVEGKEDYWPADVHLIGKDIVWFHTVIFPTILMSVNVALPKSVFCHGFVLAGDGKKMSKSLGNVVNPFEIIESYGPDAFRFHVIKETKRGFDMRFDIDNLVDMCNSDLADTIGNLVQRTLSLCQLSNESKIPPLFEQYDIDLPFSLLHFINRVEFHMQTYCVQVCCEKTVNVCKDLNKFLTELAPWKYKNEEKDKKLHIIRIMMEAIYLIAHYLDIFIPSIASQVFQKLNTPKKSIVDLNPWLNNLQEGVQINNENILFKKFEVESAQLKIQKVIMRVCKIVAILKEEEESQKAATIFEIEVDDHEKHLAVLYLPTPPNCVNTFTVAIMNIKPITINNITVNAIIPHVNKEVFTFARETNMQTGTLIKAKNYKTLVKQRDNLTKKEVNSLELSIVNGHCFFEKTVPLVFASSEDMPFYHSTQSSGPLKFF